MSEHERITEAELDEIEARASKATPGPWTVDNEGVEYATVGAGFDHRPCLQRWAGSDAHYINGSREEDANFIAASRADVPALVAEVRRLQRKHQQNVALIGKFVSELDRKDERIAELESRERASYEIEEEFLSELIGEDQSDD